MMQADINLNVLSNESASDVDPKAYQNAIKKTLEAMKHKNSGE